MGHAGLVSAAILASTSKRTAKWQHCFHVSQQASKVQDVRRHRCGKSTITDSSNNRDLEQVRFSLCFFNGKRMRYLGNEDAAKEHVRAREWTSHTKVTAIHCAYTSTDILHYWMWMLRQANTGKEPCVEVNHEHQKANPCGETSTMWLLSARKKCWHTTSTTTIEELNAFSLAE